MVLWGKPLLTFCSHMHFPVHPDAEDLGFRNGGKLHTSEESAARKLFQFGFARSSTFCVDETADKFVFV